MDTATAGTLLIVGSLVFLVGAFVGVPRVFMEPDPEVRLQLIERRLTLWRMAQPMYWIGPVITCFGVAALVASSSDSARASWLAASFVLLLAGTVFWGLDVFPRMIYHREFALGELPGWPFVGYVWLTVLGLGALGVGLLAAGPPTWIAWLTLGSDVGFLLFYVSVRDIPPFFFYLLFVIVGVALI